MRARVTIYDDNDNPKGAYELKPSRIYEGDISTKYVFEFEYNHLNYDKYKAERIGHCKDCKWWKWWKDGDGIFRRGIGAESKCPINSEVVYEGKGYCYMFEPQESEVST